MASAYCLRLHQRIEEHHATTNARRLLLMDQAQASSEAHIPLCTHATYWTTLPPAPQNVHT